MEGLDIAVVAIIAVSALFAFVRGFTREALSIAAWLGGHRRRLLFRAVRQGQDGCDPAGEMALGRFWPTSSIIIPPFLVAVILFSIIVGIIAAQVRKTALGALDRALGLLFGVARGVLLVCLAYLVLIHMVKPEDTSRPGFSRRAAGRCWPPAPTRSSR